MCVCCSLVSFLSAGPYVLGSWEGSQAASGSLPIASGSDAQAPTRISLLGFEMMERSPPQTWGSGGATYEGYPSVVRSLRKGWGGCASAEDV